MTKVKQCTFDATQERWQEASVVSKAKSARTEEERNSSIEVSKLFHKTTSERAIKDYGHLGSLIEQCTYYVPTYVRVSIVFLYHRLQLRHT
jgi:hypothetical protein